MPQKTEVDVTATCSKVPQAQDSEQTEADSRVSFFDILHYRVQCISPQVPENEEALELVRDTIKDQDKEIVESWKDELNNLLVFVSILYPD